MFVSRPPAQVEPRRSVTAGHGMVTAGRPVLSHGRSRRRGSGLGSHDTGPAARASAARHAGVTFSRTLACTTEVAVHLCGTCRRARLSRPTLSRRGQPRSRSRTGHAIVGFGVTVSWRFTRTRTGKSQLQVGIFQARPVGLLPPSLVVCLPAALLFKTISVVHCSCSLSQCY